MRKYAVTFEGKTEVIEADNARYTDTGEVVFHNALSVDVDIFAAAVKLAPGMTIKILLRDDIETAFLERGAK